MMSGYRENESDHDETSDGMLMGTYAWRWDGWWLKESNFDVLCVCLDTTSSWTTDDLWVRIFEESLSISCIGLDSSL